MLRTTALPQAAADQPGLTKHEAAIFHTLSWADEAAADHDHAGALERPDLIEAIGSQRSTSASGPPGRWRRGEWYERG